MSFIMPGKRRRLRAATVLLSSTAFVLAYAGTASAGVETAPAAPDEAAIAEMVRTQDHEMGSQIRLHEGTADMPSVTPQNIGVEATVAGIDVSGHQGNVDWASYWNQGKRFVWVKATEGTTYKNPYFAQQYNGSFNQGFVRGSYHFALPNNSGGAAQADFFSNNGGGWSADGKTLPGAMDMEYNPYGATCYGLSKAAMTQWILDFSNRYKARWSKFPAIYTSASWWSQCVSGDFSSTNPLWVARYAAAPGTLPCCWGFYTVWQYSSSPIDQNSWNGTYDRLLVFARTAD
jgi:GH25 family lysozyme M1 (1,4-beta-N-acetylmuramidase)